MVPKSTLRIAETPALTFQKLRQAYNHDPADERVDQLAAELISHLAQFRGPILVAIIKPDFDHLIDPLAFILEPLGAGIRTRRLHNKHGTGTLIFIEPRPQRESAFVGATVREYRRAKAVPA